MRLPHTRLYCTYAALQRYPTANEVQLRWELVGHLCRCNAYDKIMAAVQAAASSGWAHRKQDKR